MKAIELVGEFMDLGPDEAGLLATVAIYGVPHHLCLIEVKWEGALQAPLLDPYGRYEALQNLYEGCYLEVTVPSLPGRRFVGFVVPYAD
jgi:hypothetical protein